MSTGMTDRSSGGMIWKTVKQCQSPMALSGIYSRQIIENISCTDSNNEISHPIAGIQAGSFIQSIIIVSKHTPKFLYLIDVNTDGIDSQLNKLFQIIGIGSHLAANGYWLFV